VKDAAIEGLHFAHRLIAFDGKQNVTRGHGLSLFFQPFDERALLHGPTEARHDDFHWHSL
jgi:hypothetical protein